MIYDFMNLILFNIGCPDLLVPLSELLNSFNGITWDSFSSLLNPSIIFSWIYYFGWAFASWQVILVYPFRLFKKLIKFPHKKEVK